jgi:hypothetical protein
MAILVIFISFKKKKPKIKGKNTHHGHVKASHGRDRHKVRKNCIWKASRVVPMLHTAVKVGPRLNNPIILVLFRRISFATLLIFSRALLNTHVRYLNRRWVVFSKSLDEFRSHAPPEALWEILRYFSSANFVVDNHFTENRQQICLITVHWNSWILSHKTTINIIT